MARAIIRASINGPSPNNKMDGLGRMLKGQGFTRIGTGAYEGDLATMTALMQVLRDVLAYFDGLETGYAVDHLWWYMDGTSGV